MYFKKKVTQSALNEPVIKKQKGTSEEIAFWCKKYNLDYNEYECDKCNGIYKMNVLYVNDGLYFGLESSPCENCGHHTIRKEFISLDTELNETAEALMGFGE